MILLEILGIIFLLKKIKTLMEAKGYKASSYQWKAVGIWLGIEMIAVIIFVLYISPNLQTANLSALLVAGTSGLVYYQSLLKLPNRNSNEENRN